MAKLNVQIAQFALVLQVHVHSSLLGFGKIDQIDLEHLENHLASSAMKLGSSSVMLLKDLKADCH